MSGCCLNLSSKLALHLPKVVTERALDEERAQGIQGVQGCKGALAIPPLICYPGELLSL